MKLWLDRETYAEVDLKEVGAYQYSQTAEDLLIAYAIDDGPAQVWDCTEDPMVPTDLAQAMAEALEVWAHNAAFDRAVHNGPNQAHLPRIDLPRWRCTMALALSHALPGSLDSLCKVLRIPEDMAKLKEGKKLLNLFTRPQPANRKIRRATRFTHPAEWARFKLYAANDIVATREAHKRMPKWNWDDTCVAEWHCDQRINERGFQVDQELTRAGAAAAIVEKERIGVRFRELTHDVVERPSQREQFKAYVSARFEIELPDTTKDTFALMIKNGESTGELKELMELSMASNKTSTAKYATLDPAVMADGRFRGGLQFAGAGRTRRWAGRLFQPQNLPSRGLPPAELVELYIECLKLGTHDLFFDDLMRYGAAALRGIVIPRPGTKLSVADLSNIEGRVLAWVAGELWKLIAFRDYDTGTGPDLYKVTAGIITGVDPWKVAKEIRNSLGKVADLACLGPDTQVLTDRGLLAITEVKSTDKLWDGQEWVSHEGLQDNGVRPVVHVDGITATPDHLINTQGTWVQAQQLATCENTLNQALATGSEACKSWVLSAAPGAASGGWRSCAIVGTLGLFWKPICARAKRLAAMPVPKKPRLLTSRIFGGMQTCARTMHTGVGCSTVSQPASNGVATPKTQRTQTMVGAASECIQRGSLTEKSSCGTCSPCLDGMCQCLNWTASESTMGTSPGTCGSSPSEKTTATDEQCRNCKLESPTLSRVYDLLNAGPRHRFLVKSNSGWLLVHNSGYMGGVAGYQNFARAYGVKMADYWDVLQRQVSPELIEKAHTNLATWGAGGPAELEISEVEWLASEACKLAWRARHPATVKFWYALQDAMKAAIRDWGSIHNVGKFLKVKGVTYAGNKWLVIRLPSGRFLTYFQPRVLDDGISYMGEASEEGRTTRQWVPVFTHGGKATGNVCQTIARDILAPALIHAENRGYLPVLTVHDEIITEVPDNCDYSAKGLAEILSTNPVWAPDLPLAAAGFEGYRYKKD